MSFDKQMGRIRVYISSDLLKMKQSLAANPSQGEEMSLIEELKKVTSPGTVIKVSIDETAHLADLCARALREIEELRKLCQTYHDAESLSSTPRFGEHQSPPDR